jgi:steroid 5-alpha reductase family enzyme
VSHLQALAAAGAALVAGVMLALWLVGIRIRNMSVVDIGWAANFTLLALVDGLAGDGLPARRLLAGAMFVLWSLRLSIHLARRIVGEPEEGRYVELRRRFGAGGGRVNLRFLGFFQLQAALNVLLALPLLAAAENPAPAIRPLEWFALGLWCVALAGESLADRTLARFRADPANRGRVCAAGLWRYSRHPNYFFEWALWVAYALLALASPPLGLAGPLLPVLMLYFLLRVTGIPATEAQALRSRGAAYRDYQARTSAFVPWPPRAGR